MTAFIHAISVALLHFVWQGLAIALLLRLVLAAMRDNSPRLRYTVCCIALAVMSVLPLITAVVAYQATELAPRDTIPFTNSLESASRSAYAAFSLFPHWRTVLETWALPVWCVGVLIFAIRLLYSSGHIAKLRRSGEPVDSAFAETAADLANRMGIVRPARVLLSALTDGPSVVGWLRPVILFPPAALMNLSASQLEAVLAHELAHIRRHDYLANLLQTIAETLFFYQPAIWWVSSRIRDERELCCDDIVVETCGDPVGYARALTQLERARIISPELAMTTTGGTLMYRIRRLTGVAEYQPASRLSALLAMSLAMLCLLLNVHWAKAQPQSGSEPEVRKDAIWVDSVKYGDVSVDARALGKMTTASTAVLDVPSAVSGGVQLGQSVSVLFRSGITALGKIAHIDSASASETTPVTVQLGASMTEFSGQDVDGAIHIKRLNDVMYVGRPMAVPANTEATLFKLEPDGHHAVRVKVRFGSASVNNIQVLDNLHIGDRVILNDMANYDGYDRIRIE